MPSRSDIFVPSRKENEELSKTPEAMLEPTLALVAVALWKGSKAESKVGLPPSKTAKTKNSRAKSVASCSPN